MQVVVADDEAKVRSALQLLLEQELGLAVDSEATDAQELMNWCESCGPDLVLLDWELPGLTAGDLTALRFDHPNLRIIALSGRPDARRAALTAGVDAFVSKVGSVDLLVTTIRGLLSAASNGGRDRARSQFDLTPGCRSDTVSPTDADDFDKGHS